MEKLKGKWEILIIAGAALLFIGILVATGGCGTSKEVFEKGELSITLSEPPGTLMIDPGSDNWGFDEFLVTITHQVTSDQSSDTTPASTPTVTFPNILAGDYDVEVWAENVYDEVIAYGTGTVSVIANDESTVNITCYYNDSPDGDLELDWTMTPTDLIFNPLLEMQIMGSDGVWGANNVIAETSTGVWDYDDSFPPGFYAHAFQLYSDGETKQHVSGGVEAFFIQAGKLTGPKLYEFNASTVTPPTGGSAIIVIFEDPDQPFDVVFIDGFSAVNANNTITLEASASVTVDEWSWWMNGVEEVGETASTYDFVAGPDARVDNVSVLAKSGGAYSSAGKIIETRIPVFTAADWQVPLYDDTWVIAQSSTVTCEVRITDELGDAMSDGTTVYFQIDTGFPPSLSPTPTDGNWYGTISGGDGVCSKDFDIPAVAGECRMMAGDNDSFDNVTDVSGIWHTD